MRTIGIDLEEVHKRTEAERRSFAETPNEVLRRLLEIAPTGSAAGSSEGTGGAPVGVVGRPWSGKNVTLPHGTRPS